jgi:NDP-sugar pyrophosphorylase family protein
MAMLQPSYFFDLSAYVHAAIFDECEFVWQAVAKISNFLKTLPLGKIKTEIPEGVFLVNPENIFIDEGTSVEPGAYIKGPCWIGKNSTIRHGAYIRGNVLTGEGCVIGHGTEIKNTILLDNAAAAHLAYVGDSILGNGVNLGAGTVCANLKLGRDAINVLADGKLFPTNMRKLGAIIGDRCQLGCNTVTNPGSLVGQNVFSYPSMNFGGFVPSGYTVQPAEKPILKKRLFC